MDPVNGESCQPIVSIKVKCVHTSMCVFVFVRWAGSPLDWEYTLYTCVLTGRVTYKCGKIHVMLQLIFMYALCMLYILINVYILYVLKLHKLSNTCITATEDVREGPCISQHHQRFWVCAVGVCAVCLTWYLVLRFQRETNQTQWVYSHANSFCETVHRIRISTLTCSRWQC